MGDFDEALILGMAVGKKNESLNSTIGRDKIAAALTKIGVNTPANMTFDELVDQIQSIIQVGLGRKVADSVSFQDISLTDDVLCAIIATANSILADDVSIQSMNLNDDLNIKFNGSQVYPPL
jgi:hypothetical protein